MDVEFPPGGGGIWGLGQLLHKLTARLQLFILQLVSETKYCYSGRPRRCAPPLSCFFIFIQFSANIVPNNSPPEGRHSRLGNPGSTTVLWSCNNYFHHQRDTSTTGYDYLKRYCWTEAADQCKTGPLGQSITEAETEYTGVEVSTKW